MEKDAFINLDAPEKHASYKKKWRDNQAELTRRIEATQAMTLTDEDAAALKLTASSAQDYANGFNATLQQIVGGTIGTAEDANRSFQKFKRSVHSMESTSAAMNERAIKAFQAISAPLDAQYRRTAAVQAALAAVSLLVVTALSWSISRSITRKLGGEPSYATAVVQGVAQGDLSHAVTSPASAGKANSAKYREHKSSLLFAMGQMQTQLVDMVINIRNSSGLIANASDKIASGNADMVHRRDQQGANLQQTAASMEELSATVERNANTAVHAAKLARGASVQTCEGGELVGRAVTAMQEISGSAEKIAAITGVIDSLAFQTNILALNAAVEAARAGEQGRGFAMVANEVRSLAQRSANAPKEIKALIDTSVRQVASGSKHVKDAGDTMARIVESVQTVAELIAEISRATQEQNAGLTQISDSMVELDSANQQNSVVIEQSSDASTSLHHEAKKLVALMSLFKMHAGHEAFKVSALACESKELAAV